MVLSDQSARAAKKGFTLVELLIVAAMAASLMTIVYFYLTPTLVRELENTTNDVLLAELQTQRLLAMQGKTTNAAEDLRARGVYFEQGTGRYVVFECTTAIACVYSDTNTTNITRQLPAGNLFVEVHLPQRTILFQQGSGEVLNYTDAGNTIIIGSPITNRQKTHVINSAGSITLLP